jgi:alkylation response protein AidB-like acyl-CoA dehydrogenase
MAVQTVEAQGYPEIREAVAKLCAGFPGAYWRALDRESRYPQEFVSALTEAGFLSVLIPEGYGGAGLPLSGAAAILEEIPARRLQRRGLPRANVHDGHGAAARLGRAEGAVPARNRRGRLRLQAFGVTGAEFGHRHGGAQRPPRARRRRLRAQRPKDLDLAAEHSDLMLLLARTTPLGPGRRSAPTGSRCSWSTCARPSATGLTLRPIRTMMNHATTRCFRRPSRPAENLIGEEGRGFRCILSGMNAERILIAAECVGDAKWFIEQSTAYARERVVFGAPIGRNQGVQFPIARAYANMRAAELMVREATRLFEAGAPCGAEANMAKMLAADASFEAANVCIQTHGGFGFAEEYDIERKFRETRLYQVAPISTNLILAHLAEHVLGLPRSY